MLQFVYPVLCEGCGKILLAQEEILCIECASLLPLTNYHHISNNETALRFAGRIPFEHATSLAYFTKDGLLQHLLQEFKYKGNKKVGNFFAKMLGNALSKTDWIRDIDVIVPVPLHREKSQFRGFNQSEVIAETLANQLGKHVNSRALVRLKNTDTQTHKTREQRAENMKHAFGIIGAKTLNQKHILLLDDVLTTGATIEGCVQALLEVEGVKISIVTIGVAMH